LKGKGTNAVGAQGAAKSKAGGSGSRRKLAGGKRPKARASGLPRAELALNRVELMPARAPAAARV
jgi:hypothetical protein